MGLTGVQDRQGVSEKDNLSAVITCCRNQGGRLLECLCLGTAVGIVSPRSGSRPFPGVNSVHSLLPSSGQSVHPRSKHIQTVKTSLMNQTTQNDVHVFEETSLSSKQVPQLQ